MQNIKKENYYYKIFSINLSAIFPIVALAPIGSWIPLVLSALCLIFFSRVFYKNIRFEGINFIIYSTLLWIIYSIIFLSKDLFLLEKALSLFLLFFSLLILNSFISKIPNFRGIVVFLTYSFILSSILIIIDIQFGLGLKLWLSKNFDFNNIKGFYQLKSWESLTDFRTRNNDTIMNYLNSSYDRGITSLIILSFPIILVCNLYKFKLLTLTALLNSVLLILFFSTLTMKISVLLVIFLTFIYYLKSDFFKKYFLFFLGLYFLINPFILGKLDFRKFSIYENNFLQNNLDITNEYCKKIGHFEINLTLTYNLNDLSLNCFYSDSYKTISKEGMMLFNNSRETAITSRKVGIGKTLEVLDNSEKLIIYLNYKSNNIIIQKLHRFMIWSYVKEKILDKIILGHGFSSSKHMGNEKLITDYGTIYQLIPLHAHNSILQIWLELGIIGLFLFFLIIKIIFNKIFHFNQYSKKISSVAVASSLMVFLIAQSSYGIWQSWWITIIFINIILYNFIFYNFKIFKD